MIKLKTLQEGDNKLLKRKDLMLSVEHIGESTPKTIDIANKIAEDFKTGLDKIEMVYLFTQRGKAVTKVKARIWEKGAPKKVEDRKKAKDTKEEGAEGAREDSAEKAEKPAEKPKKAKKQATEKPEEPAVKAEEAPPEKE